MSTNKNHKWEFENVGGSPRVQINSGKDIENLRQLDPKLWTVLSCPIKGLEIEDKSLKFMDYDSDGKIRIQDVVHTAEWLTSLLKDTDTILNATDSFDLELFNQEDEKALKLYNSARRILASLEKEGNVISIEDVLNVSEAFKKTRFNGDGVVTPATAETEVDKNIIETVMAVCGSVTDRSGEEGINTEKLEQFYASLQEYVDWNKAAVKAPFADETDAIIEAYTKLDPKVKDFFLRSKLAAFSPEANLDVTNQNVEAISAENLLSKTEEIGACPLARINGKGEIVLSEPLNPVWAPQFRSLIASVYGDKKKVITEKDWNDIAEKFAEYNAWASQKANFITSSLEIDKAKALLADEKGKASVLNLIEEDLKLSEEVDNIAGVEKFLYINRDFYRLLRNFVTLNDFYTKDKDVKAIFQSGRLIIDQRECHLCMKVADAAAHSASAVPSGMFLVYCSCVTKDKPGVLQIVAAVTVGDIGDLVVGKNAVYYDNDGVEWDAVITKIIDNPISIGQAFWSPYRRMAAFVENSISKRAAEKDAKMMSEATAKLEAVKLDAPADPAAAPPAAKSPFDIAKFAGIFAAIGMAVGMLGTALVALATGLSKLKAWQLVLVFFGILLLISGPAMILAWLKLRRRNIAPLLNASGWAVNAKSKISIPFGVTLTDIAKLPKLNLKDPYAKKGLPVWARWLISILTILVILAVVYVLIYFFAPDKIHCILDLTKIKSIF